MSNLGPTPELDKLYKACREIEGTDGRWNGGDVVGIVAELLAAHGYDLTPIVWCERCQEEPAADGAKLCADCAQQVADEKEANPLDESAEVDPGEHVDDLAVRIDYAIGDPEAEPEWATPPTE